ncbi:MAG: hypothetical protein RLZZ324_1173 [Candidatus Parcubacteria bacterium]|jgi:glycosyltransferase involved in cell wall biosynthesis
MRIIHANKYWYPKGGADRYALDLAALQEKHGDETAPFAMADERDRKSPWARFFVSPVQTEKVRFDWSGVKTALRSVWSLEAAWKFGDLLRAFKPDVVHVHNVYRQISPSILPVAARRGVPIVMTVHDYALVAPNYSLYHDGAICEVTKPDRFWQAAEHRCVKGSGTASALVALEMSVHRALGVWDHVGKFIAPSRFVESLLTEYGIDAGRITHVPHPIDASAWEPSYEGAYALFVGRLVEEKGVETLIRAAAAVRDVPVRIVGTGPQEAQLKALAKKLGADNVHFMGALHGDDLRAAYAGARFVVVPSRWYEVFGLIVLEAYASGKPVVATQIGGLAELVLDGDTGRFVSAGDEDDLAAVLLELWSDPAICEAMGRAGRAWVETDFTPEGHYARIRDVYAAAMKTAR